MWTKLRKSKQIHAILGERKYSKVLEKYGDEMTALQECVRPVHGKRARDYIETKMDERLFLFQNQQIFHLNLNLHKYACRIMKILNG